MEKVYCFKDIEMSEKEFIEEACKLMCRNGSMLTVDLHFVELIKTGHEGKDIQLHWFGIEAFIWQKINCKIFEQEHMKKLFFNENKEHSDEYRKKYAEIIFYMLKGNWESMYYFLTGELKPGPKMIDLKHAPGKNENAMTVDFTQPWFIPTQKYSDAQVAFGLALMADKDPFKEIVDCSTCANNPHQPYVPEICDECANGESKWEPIKRNKPKGN